MKKVFTLLTLLVAVCTGAWADDVIFSMTSVTNGKTSVASGATQSISATYNTGSSAEVKNGHADSKEMIDKNNVVNIGGSGNSYFHATFTTALAAGDVITSSTESDFYICKTSTKPGSTVTFPYTIKSTDTDLIGGTNLYVWKGSSGKSFTSFTITRVTGTAAPTITQTGSSVTLECATDGATIYYTIDGSEPTTSSATYSTAITLTNSCTVRAFAKKGDDASDIVKKDCYVSHSSVEKYLTSLGYNGGTVDGDVWTGTNFTITNNVATRGINYVNLAGSQDGFKLNHTDSYTIQPSEGIKVTKLVVVGKTWLQGIAGNAATIAFDDWTPASGTFFDYLTDGETYVKTFEFTPSTEQTYGQAITMRPGNNQVGAYIEVYGDIKTYAVTYAAGANGTGTIPAGEKTHGQDFTLSSSTFTRDGFVQTGWATSDGGPQLYALGGSYTANADVTLYPVWAKVASVTAFNYTDGKTISQLEALGWTFNSAVFDGDPADTEAYVNLVSAFTAADLTAPGNNSMADNAIAFAKNTSAYAMYDLGATKPVTAVNATLYGGSSSSFDATIEYIGADGSTVKKSYSTIALNAGNWHANNVSLTDEVSGVRYIKVYGASKWMVMYNLSVTYKESVSVGTKSGRNYASYVTSEKLDFGSAEGITAYIATGLNTGKTAVEMTPVSVVPAGTPIIVKTDTKGAIINVPVTTADASDTSSNLLVAGNGSSIGGEGKYDYILSGDMFYRASEGVLAVGKAYLHFDTAPARELSLIFEDEEVTGIRSVDNGKVTIDNAVYDLSGRRVANPTKGLYIVNGKKVILK